MLPLTFRLTKWEGGDAMDFNIVVTIVSAIVNTTVNVVRLVLDLSSRSKDKPHS